MFREVVGLYSVSVMAVAVQLVAAHEIFMQDWKEYWVELKAWNERKKACLMFATTKAARRGVEKDHNLGEVTECVNCVLLLIVR